MKTNVLLVDQHRFFVDCLKQRLPSLDPDIKIVGAAHTAKDAICLVIAKSPDVILTDIFLPDATGFRFVEQALKDRSATKAIFISDYTNPAYIHKAARIGAVGYLFKDAELEKIHEAIRHTLSGGIYAPPSWDQHAAQLSPRETEVLNLKLQGLMNEDICKALCISTKTCASYCYNLCQRLGVPESQFLAYSLAADRASQ